MWDVMAGSISLRSFSSLWYWLALAAFWIWTVRQVMGVPQDLLNAARHNAAAAQDCAALAQIQARRQLRFRAWAQVARVGLVALVFGFVTALGFGYGIEWAQAIWLIGAPYLIVAQLNRRAAMAILGLRGPAQDARRVLARTGVMAQIVVFIALMLAMVLALVHALNGFAG